MKTLKHKQHRFICHALGILVIWLHFAASGLTQTTPSDPTPIAPNETASCERVPIASDAENDVENAEAYYQLGVSLFDDRCYEAAVAALTRAIELNPNDSDAYAWRGAAYDALNDVEAAIQDFNVAIQLDFPQVLSEWLSQQRPGEREEARELLDNGRRWCEPGNSIDRRSRGLSQLREALNLYIAIRDSQGESSARRAIGKCQRTQT